MEGIHSSKTSTGVYKTTCYYNVVHTLLNQCENPPKTVITAKVSYKIHSMKI
jgi:hypothetical protein